MRTSCLFLIIASVILCGCDSRGKYKTQAPELPEVGQSSEGYFVLNSDSATITGALQLTVFASDADGISRITLSFGDGTESALICEGAANCGTVFSDIIGGISPYLYGAAAGQLTLTLTVTDTLGTTTDFHTDSVDWEPILLQDIVIERSTDGSSITATWSADSRLLRYNVYLATEPGVNQLTFTNLDNGDARLALEDTQITITGLQPQLTYYVLITGVDGSGEAAFSGEFEIVGGSNTNLPPVLQDDDVTLDEDTSVVISVLDNDTDPDGDAITIDDASATTGMVSVTPSHITYQPLANYVGTDTVIYSVLDSAGNSASASVNITVLPINDPPTANNDSGVSSGAAITIDVLANDFDVDGDALAVSSATAVNGAVIINNDQTLTYTPTSGFNGTDTISYIAVDPDGESAQATVTVTVSSAPLSPAPAADFYRLVKNATVSIHKSSGVLINDTDPGNLGLQVSTTPVTPPASGTVTLDAEGGFVYAANSGFTGTDSFVYEVINTSGLTANATVTLTVDDLTNNLFADSSSMTGEFDYIGRGETSTGSGVGTGLYRIGDCVSLTNTTCTMSGRYSETASSGRQPFQQGTYSFIMAYPGTGDSTVMAQSSTAGSDSVFLSALNGATFTLYLFTDDGDMIVSSWPDNNFGTLVNFSAFIVPQQTCTGIPSNETCRIGRVGLYNNATLNAPMDFLQVEVNGFAMTDVSGRAIAIEDTFVYAQDTTLVTSESVLDNDTDRDIPVAGDSLMVRNTFANSLSQPVALAVNELTQHIFTYTAMGTTITITKRDGSSVGSFSWPGEPANDADMDIAPIAFTLGNTLVPQGTLLVFNGETAEAEVYALDPDTGSELVSLNTGFGNSHVVGGAYNPVSESLFLLQDNVPGTNNGNTIAEIDPQTGLIINQFAINQDNQLFNVSFGDIDINNVTGNLYLVSSLEGRIAEFTRTGTLVRYYDLPSAASSVSGLSINQERDRLYVVNNRNTPVMELSFINGGKLNGFIASLITPPEHGALTLNPDGTFIYVPDSGYSGDDSFLYEVSDQTGYKARARVFLTTDVAQL
ncbi:tandem-95 repeat protein [Aestuariibacter sp. GS-14]|uniref:Ig-like domain-containing protein n=1 Tax=Aestuariibacter sp. GS-14 TaxID=2590670 RepID=UPI0011279C91|nr:Ig-like domain-containing protein [Aestuariibacter sp. GS-14]TPV62238.1 tandem-95 repeat protein [Aestuariibacter sp. GS-14]